jgi:preprotein translocase SecF subunit
MIELFKEPKIQWIKAKKYFITVSIALLVVGGLSVQLRGFNLGVDFDGGTIMTVRFGEPPSLDEIRSALAAGGVDTNKVTIQSDVARPNELLIRAPQITRSESEQRLDEDKRSIIRALQRLNPAGDIAAGKVNINTVDTQGVEQELREVDPLGINEQIFSGAHPYTQVGDQLMAFRNGPHKGFLNDIGPVQGLPLSISNMENFDHAKVKAAIMDRFYAGKIDLNLASVKEIQDALARIDPLQIGAQTQSAETYRKAAEAVGNYRKGRSDVVGSLEEIQAQDVPADLPSKMDPYFMTGQWAVISADVVGPQVGKDLQTRAIYVTLAALAGMLIYIAFRFEWIYGVAAVLAVFHDVLVTLGLFSLFRTQPGWEINLTVVAALLTLIGYSMNDTIVIFDRIRENLRLRRRDNLVQITNDSINQTLSRSVITNGLTFLSVVSIVFFGGEVLRGFGLALTVGIVVGTFSTVAVASPIMLWWQSFVAARRGIKTQPVKSKPVEQSVAKGRNKVSVSGV